MKIAFKVLGIVLVLLGLFWMKSLYDDARHALHKVRAIGLLSGINTSYYAGSLKGVARNVVVHDGKRDVSTSTVVRVSDYEMISYSGGVADGVVVKREGNETRIYKPTKKIVEVIRVPMSKSLHESPSSLLRNYKPRFLDDSKVIGQPVWVLFLTPKDNQGPTKKLWIDTKHHVILKSEDRSSKGELLSSMEFLKIKYDVKLSDIDCQVPAHMARWKVQESEPVISEAEAERILGAKPVYPKVPSGYNLEGLRSYECKCLNKHKSVHVRYTNGINSISVFECPAMAVCCMQKGEMKCGMGGCKMMQGKEASVAAKTVGRVSISVVSDMPQKELRQIIDSVR